MAVNRGRVVIERVVTPEQIDSVVALARTIWNQHFVPIIGQQQVDYMLDKFQSPLAIQEQLDEGYEYYSAGQAGKPIGYLALRPNEPTGKVMVSKIYIRQEARGRGAGEALLQFARRRAAGLDTDALWLTVNRENRATIDWYKKRGFTISEEAQFDIGNGFVMDDYIMELRLD